MPREQQREMAWKGDLTTSRRTPCGGRSLMLAWRQSRMPAGRAYTKALMRLVEQGIVVERRVGERYPYEANPEHLLLPSVRTRGARMSTRADPLDDDGADTRTTRRCSQGELRCDCRRRSKTRP